VPSIVKPETPLLIVPSVPSPMNQPSGYEVPSTPKSSASTQKSAAAAVPPTSKVEPATRAAAAPVATTRESFKGAPFLFVDWCPFRLTQFGVHSEQSSSNESSSAQK